MAPDSYHVTETELAVLEVLWDEGPAPIRTISDRLYPRGGSSNYATVQKLLERLESKGCVARDRSTFAHTFRATIDRDVLLGEELKEVASKLCEGSLTPLLLHLVKDHKLSPGDRETLRRLLDDAPEQDS